MLQFADPSEALRLEAQRVASHPADRAEMRSVHEDMDSVSAPGPRAT